MRIGPIPQGVLRTDPTPPRCFYECRHHRVVSYHRRGLVNRFDTLQGLVNRSDSPKVRPCLRLYRFLFFRRRGPAHRSDTRKGLVNRSKSPEVCPRLAVSCLMSPTGSCESVRHPKGSCEPARLPEGDGSYLLCLCLQSLVLALYRVANRQSFPVACGRVLCAWALNRQEVVPRATWDVSNQSSRRHSRFRHEGRCGGH